MRRRIGVAAAIVLVAAGLAVPAAQAKAHMLVGIQDDAMTLRGNPTFTFPTLKQLRTQIVRINLNWNEVAKRRPGAPAGSRRPCVRLGALRPRRSLFAAQYGMQVLLTILFTPSWANGGGERNVPPTNYTDLQKLRVRGRNSLQRSLHPEHRLVRRGLPAGREVLAGLERAEQPELAAADVRRALRQPALLRADLHGDLAGRPLHELRRREGRAAA